MLALKTFLVGMFFAGMPAEPVRLRNALDVDFIKYMSDCYY